MCGLIAILDWVDGGWASSLEATRAVKAGLDRMSYRGLPGRSIVVQQGRTIIGHTRLPIISSDSYFDQPQEFMGVVGAFVGEIFNYESLGKKPPPYITHPYTSDTEALIKTFNTYSCTGEGFHEFDGFWAAILVEQQISKISVFTDYLSQKPLYFHKDSLLVASEPEAIRVAYPHDWEYDETYLSNVLKWGYSPDHRTPWEGLQQLPVGSVLTYLDGVAIEPYWDWSKVPIEPDLRATLTQAVKNRLVGDRAVAILLSGGLDSTIIYEILKQELNHVYPFNVENGEDDRYINLATQDYYKLKTVAVTLDEGVKAHQVPVDLGSMIPQLELAKALRVKNYHVAMSGDGADELFGGYRRAKEYDSQASDVFTELPFYHLPRLDRLMMNQTIELRCPFLAPKVVKKAFALPWDVRQSKQFLKHAFQGIVPQKILDRPKHPLKSNEVLTGGIEYRKKLVEIWKESIHTHNPNL